jgi:predicted DsbA family dithiol-disulfide isomerase
MLVETNRTDAVIEEMASWTTGSIKQVPIFMVIDKTATLNERQVMAEILRCELAKAKEDPSHIVIVPFAVDIVLTTL